MSTMTIYNSYIGEIQGIYNPDFERSMKLKKWSRVGMSLDFHYLTHLGFIMAKCCVDNSRVVPGRDVDLDCLYFTQLELNIS